MWNRMEQWLESVYADGSKYFVSNPLPRKREKITIYIRMHKALMVKNVILLVKINGVEVRKVMIKDRIVNDLVYYRTKIGTFEECLRYCYIITTKDQVYYYTQKAITTHLQNEMYYFKILFGYQQPSWVKDAVFYQIIPDRFYNGNLDISVKDNEYAYNGDPVIEIKNWNQPPLEYHDARCLDFYGGDLLGIQKKIPYLKELGVTAVCLSPVFVSPTVHKYDTIDYFNIDPHLGGNEAFQNLVTELHKNDIKIILDISIGYTSIEHELFNKEGTFFDKGRGAYHNDAEKDFYYFFGELYKCFMGIETLPVLNYTNYHVKNLIYGGEQSVINKWLSSPYHIDGWKFISATSVARCGDVRTHNQVWEELCETVKEANPAAYIIGEEKGDCTEYMQGEKWDAATNYFGCARPIRAFIGEKDLCNINDSLFTDVDYQYTAKDLSEQLCQHYCRMPWVVQQIQFNFLDNMETCRLHNNPMISKEAYKAAMVLLFTVLGAPCIYYGDEVEIDGGIRDPERYRYPMSWSDAPEKTEQYILTKKLVEIRKDEVFAEGGFKIIYDCGNIFAFARFTDKKIYFIISSMEEENKRITIPLYIFGIQTITKERDDFGSKLRYTVADRCLIIQVEAKETYLFDVEI